jgi:tRNA (guanine37-N1)-methyltransferase
VQYTVYTLFPQLLAPWREEALLGRAARAGLIELDLRDLRAFANDRHNKVDDTPYGGGAGMVIRVDVAARAIEEARSSASPPDEVILLSPAGRPLSQELAEELSTRSHLCLLCGRYEGFDARVERLVDREISVGDYVLMGGELAALALIEATARLLPGVLGDEESHRQDSFVSGLLDYPEYTRPASFEGMDVPEILMSGHHGRVQAWRRREALRRTHTRRPELLARAPLDDADRQLLAEIEAEERK